MTLVLYTYFIAALMGRQMLPGDNKGDGTKYEDPDLYFPLFTALQVSLLHVSMFQLSQITFPDL